MTPQLEEASAMLRLAGSPSQNMRRSRGRFQADRLADSQIPVPLTDLRYDDAEIEMENVNRTELIQMVNTARAWAEGVFLAAVSTEADS